MRKVAIFAAALLVAAVQAVPASAATFLFIRHGESTTNANTFTSVQEFLDPPLTPLGQQQAIDLAGRLANTDIRTIFTSAYQRTQATIAPTAAEFGLTPIADERFNEWYLGDLNSLADLQGINPLAVIGAWAGGNPDAKLNLPHAESLNDVAARVVPAWQEVFDTYKDREGVVVLVGHGVETGFVMPYFARNITTSFAFSHGLQNTGIIQLENVGGQPYVTNWQGIAVPVPEPMTWLMLLVGFGAVGASMRRSGAEARRLISRQIAAG